MAALRRTARGAAQLLLALALLAPANACAQQRERASGSPDADRNGWVSELRFGVLGHDFAPINTQPADGVQLNAEVRFVSPEFLSFMLAPRPQVGASINTAGDTSLLYLGLTWTWTIRSGLFLDFSFSGTVHDGILESSDVVGRKQLGSRVLFREGLEIGYQLADRHSLSIGYAHASNAGLATRNQGNDEFGIRYGYRF